MGDGIFVRDQTGGFRIYVFNTPRRILKEGTYRMPMVLIFHDRTPLLCLIFHDRTPFKKVSSCVNEHDPSEGVHY